MLHWTLLALSAAVLLAMPARAEDAPDATPAPACQRDGKVVSDTEMQAARNIMTLSKASERIHQVMDAMTPAMIDIVRKSQTNIPESVLSEISTEVRAETDAETPAVLEMEACIYVQHYTTDELQQLAAFYGTPLGQKMLATSPQVLKESMALGQAWGRQVGMRAMQRVLARHKKPEDKI